jgi:TonB-dependent starch-binding outer membrane protein SusC
LKLILTLFFLYRSEAVENKQVKQSLVSGGNVEQSLNALLENTGLHFKYLNPKTYGIYEDQPDPAFIPADELMNETVTGQVVDAQTGESLPGVNILVQGTTTGTSTNVDGEFELTVPSLNEVIVVTYIGYQTQVIPLDGRSEINIEMVSQAIEGGELVVIGYGTQQRRDLTSSISSISGENIASARTSSIDKALQGQLPGVVVTTNDATPGGDISIRIRGYGTAATGGNNSPLVVIDGVPSQRGLNELDPNNIQSIDVLKDAASASVYGVRAANGVIVVTTKQGRPGETQVSVDLYSGISQPWRNSLEVLTAQEHAVLLNKTVSILNEGLSPGDPSYTIPNPAYANPSLLPNPGTDWQDAIYRNAAPFQNYNIGVTGGTDQTLYALSIGHRNEQGVIRNSSMERYNISANIDHDITGYFKMGSRISYNQRSRDGSATNEYNGAPYNALAYPRVLPIREDDGNWGIQPNLNWWQWGDAKNPVILAEHANQITDNNSLTGSIFGRILPSENIALESMVGFARFFGGSRHFNLQTPVTRDNILNPTPATLSESSYNNLNYNWDNTLTYMGSIGDHNLNSVVGTSYQFENSAYIGANQAGFQERGVAFRYFGFGDPATYRVESNEWERQMFSYFGRLNYDYKNKYLGQVVVRRDASSVFSKENRWGTFPAASVGWRISEEGFMSGVNFIDDLKIRGSWGRSGNQDIGDVYPTFDRISVGDIYVIGDQVFSGIRPSQLGNQNIIWETNEQFDVGLDLWMFNNSISFTFDYYERQTKDMLIKVPIPGIAGGAEAPAQNVGSILNKGLEFALSYYKTVNQDFYFRVSANAATLTNRVTDLATVDFILPPSGSLNVLNNPVTRAVVGSSVSQFFGYKFGGVFQNQQEIDCAFDPTCTSFAVPDRSRETVAPGDAYWIDVNGDGIIDADDRTTLGDAIPKLTYGLNISANYKNFDFRTLIQGVSGVKIFSVLKERVHHVYSGANVMREALNYWDGEGSTNTNTRLISEAGNWRVSDRFIENGDYIRMRNLEIGYTLPAHLTNRLDIRNVRIYVAANNLITITNYFAYEPEIGQNSNLQGAGNADLHLGVDQGVYPQARTFAIGTSIQF